MIYDVAIVGSGIGGYPAALYLADKGLRVAIVEKHLVGGECTNYGCVPSKALYDFAESLKNVEKLGSRVDYDWQNLMEWIKSTVQETRGGLETLLESRDVTLVRGQAFLKGPGRLLVSNINKSEELEADKLILALGTDPAEIPSARFDGKGIVSNREAFYLLEKPEKVLIIGGGIIGVELANMYSALGVEVTIVELLEHILPFTDRDIAVALRTYLMQRGVKVIEKIAVQKLGHTHGKYTADLSNGQRLEIDKVIVAVGRKPKTGEMGLETLLQLDEKGFIKVNDRLETSMPGVYACGDVIGGPLLAHKALLESIAVAKRINQEESFTVNYQLVPTTIFSGLEIASIGYTEKDLLAKGVKYTKVKLPLYYMAKMKIKGHKNSFIKILLDDRMGKILGLHLVSPNASEIVSAYIPVYIGRMKLEEVARTPYPHLTLSESLRDLAEYIIGTPMHLLKK
ncbi:MAG: dihydrolipoyl dehydrogenase [Desulfurococcaceae archaeon]